MTALLFIGGVIAAAVLIGIIIVASARLTERKTNEELSQRLADGSAINHDSHSIADTSGGGCGGGGD